MSDATPSPEEVRALLRECVTVMRPGEMLVIRIPHATPGKSPAHISRYWSLPGKPGGSPRSW